MKLALLAGVVLFLIPAVVLAQVGGAICFFADPAGSDCTLSDTTPGTLTIHVVHTGTPGATAVQFSAPKPACMVGATWLDDTWVFPVTIGDSQTAAVDFRFVLGNVTQLFLDLASVTDATEGKGMRVHGVTSGGRPVQWVHEGDRLRITLDAAPAAGERRQFVVRYDGIPASGFNIGPNNFDERTFFSVNWPNKARQWLPMRTAAAAADDHHAHRRR